MRRHAAVEQLGGEVEPHHVGARRGGAQRDVSGSGGHVQHVLARTHVDAVEQVARRHLVDALRRRRRSRPRPRWRGVSCFSSASGVMASKLRPRPRFPHRCRLPMFDPAGTYVSDFAAWSCSSATTALAALAEARAAAARRRGPGGLRSAASRGSARPRWCGGSPATSPAAAVLFGTCDDLSIPRPLGPFRDLAGSVSAELEDALAGGAAPHDIQDLLIAELERPPRPTVLVLEDVHWADDATLDSITVLGRRIGALPALRRAHLPQRRGAARPPAARGARRGPARRPGAARARAAVARRGRRRSPARTATTVYAATGGNPFYVTELLASRDAAELPPSVANAVLARVSRLDDAARRPRGAGVGRAEPRRAPTCSTRVMPGWAAAAEEPERRQLLELDGALRALPPRAGAATRCCRASRR